jgi:hypothetical protein
MFFFPSWGLVQRRDFPSDRYFANIYMEQGKKWHEEKFRPNNVNHHGNNLWNTPGGRSFC